jgi:isopenicillin-N epimerase
VTSRKPPPSQPETGRSGPAGADRRSPLPRTCPGNLEGRLSGGIQSHCGIPYILHTPPTRIFPLHQQEGQSTTAPATVTSVDPGCGPALWTLFEVAIVDQHRLHAVTSRRDFLRTAGLAGLATAVPGSASHPQAPPSASSQERLTPHPAPPAQAARDEAYWRRVAAQYDVIERPTNLEAGYYGLMARPVLAAYHRHIDRVNSASSYFARREYPALERAARERVAQFIGATTGEVLFTRNATEALQSLIGQYLHVGEGDTVMYADLDYGSMQLAMNALAERRGATRVAIDLPEPASRQGILDAYEAALRANPRTRLLLVTHCNNKTGLIHPVRDIIALARPRGVDVIVDAAHSFGQVPLTVSDLDADFVGFNLHKWIGAPVGVGGLYIRASRLDAIGRAHGDETALERIEGRVHTGTTAFATTMTIPDALDFQASIGIAHKSARLRYLRDRWVAGVRGTPGVDVLTPDAPELVCALTGFRLHGRGSREANIAATRLLLEEFGIFTVQRTGLAAGDCVRVTPTLYNTPADADRLADALKALAARGPLGD